MSIRTAEECRNNINVDEDLLIKLSSDCYEAAKAGAYEYIYMYIN